MTLARTLAPILPFLAEDMYQNLIGRASAAGRPGQRPPDALAGRRDGAAWRDQRLEASMAVARRAVELARTLRSQAGLRVRQPLARAWLAIPDRGVDGRRPSCST